MSTLEIILLCIGGTLVLIYAIMSIYRLKHPKAKKKKHKNTENNDIEDND